MKAALLLTFVAFLTLAGCCNCGPRGDIASEERPGDVVRALRDAVVAEHYDVAAKCFPDDVWARHGAALVRRWFQAGDQVTWATVQGELARVTVEHDGLPDGEKPTLFELRRDDGRWKIVAWRS